MLIVALPKRMCDYVSPEGSRYWFKEMIVELHFVENKIRKKIRTKMTYTEDRGVRVSGVRLDSVYQDQLNKAFYGYLAEQILLSRKP
jgi:hypothetical protein